MEVDHSGRKGIGRLFDAFVQAPGAKLEKEYGEARDEFRVVDIRTTPIPEIPANLCGLARLGYKHPV